VAQPRGPGVTGGRVRPAQLCGASCVPDQWSGAGSGDLCTCRLLCAGPCAPHVIWSGGVWPEANISWRGRAQLRIGGLHARPVAALLHVLCVLTSVSLLTSSIHTHQSMSDSRACTAWYIACQGSGACVQACTYGIGLHMVPCRKFRCTYPHNCVHMLATSTCVDA